MSRENLVAVARREIENLQADQIDLAAGVLEVPASSYIDPERWQREVDLIFKRLPLALAFSCELKEPGSYKALQTMDTPVLLTRGADGEVHAFLNSCSHRGAIVVDEGCGTAKGFRCPYHAWAYDMEGRLLNVFDAKNFGPVDKSVLGLTPLKVAERAGLIWVVLKPSSDIDIDDFLAGYGPELSDLGFADGHMVGSQQLVGPNWKVAYDGYRDLYHIPILHKNSFGPDSAYQADYYAYGPHVRMVSPRGYEKLMDKPEGEWMTDELTPGVWTIFPNISIAGGGAGGYMVSMMFPGKSVGESITTQNFIQPGNPEDDKPEEIAARMAFLGKVVGEEDYYTGLRIQKSLATGAKRSVLFGRNEGGGQLFHRWIEKLVSTSDAELPGLLRNGLEGDRTGRPNLGHIPVEAAAGGQ